MHSLNLECYGLQPITEQELTSIDGGHEGMAYSTGYYLGQFVVTLGAVAGGLAVVLASL